MPYAGALTLPRRRLLLPGASRIVPPKPTGLLRAIDLSSNQPRDRLSVRRILGDYKPDHVILKLYLSYESSGLDRFTVDQAGICREWGASLGGYCWGYRYNDARGTVHSALATAHKAGIWPLPVLWLDCEIYSALGHADYDPGPNIPWMDAFFDECDLLGQFAGIYTGGWFWIGNDAWGYGVQNTKRFADRPLWDANYGRQPTLGLPGYGGWNQKAAHQYAGSPIDQSIIAAWAATAA
jgi:hypothetical protein